jgi:hypothetical protein
VCLLAAALLVPSAGFAQTKRKTDKYESVKHIDIDDPDPIEGTLLGPGGDTITGKRRIDHLSLIRYRSSFIPELLKRANDI